MNFIGVQFIPTTLSGVIRCGSCGTNVVVYLSGELFAIHVSLDLRFLDLVHFGNSTSVSVLPVVSLEINILVVYQIPSCVLHCASFTSAIY